MRKRKNAFDAWFLEQFGPRPTKKSRSEIADEVFSAIQAQACATNLMRDLDRWDSAYGVALKTWNAGKGKPREK